MEILRDGNVIPNSNLVDMLHYFTSNIAAKRLNLQGLVPVSCLLRQSNAPMSLFGRAARQDFEKGIDEVDSVKPKNIFKWTSYEQFNLQK